MTAFQLIILGDLFVSSPKSCSPLPHRAPVLPCEYTDAAAGTTWEDQTKLDLWKTTTSGGCKISLISERNYTWDQGTI